MRLVYINSSQQTMDGWVTLGTVALTYNIGLQSFGHQAACNLQILWRALPHLQTTSHAHTLQHLDVIVDLEHAVEIEQILEPADERG